MGLPRRAVGICAIALSCAAIPTTASAAIVWGQCQGSQSFQCGGIDVPLDPSGAQPGTIHLAAARLPASAIPAATTAVVALAGGPGQAALPIGTDFAVILASALNTRDFLVFDQRGIGSSSALKCAALTAPSRTLSATVRRCAEEIGPSRAFYTSAQSVADIEALRVAGGYDKLLLYGVSYGTKVALAYAAAHPDHVEALVLDSVVTPEGPDALRRSSFAAVPRVISQDLCGNGACRGINSSPVSDIRKLAARLARHAISGSVYSPLGLRYTAHLSAGGLFSILLAGDLNPTLRAELPGALRAALTGDVKPILRLSARSAGLENRAGYQSVEADNDAVYFDTTCEDSMTLPWTRGAPVAQRSKEFSATIAGLPAGATAMFPRTVAREGVADLCFGWPEASPAPAPPGPLPDVPTLVIDGQSDLRTPLEDAAALTAKFPRGQLLGVPHSGHSVLGSEPGTCAAEALTTFFSGGTVAPCPAIANPFSPTPRPPLSLKNVAKVKGYPATVGRTLNALFDTITDGRRQLIGEALALGATPAGAGGLRGGAVRVTATGYNFHHYEYVPGLQISGTFKDGGTSRYTITGKSAAHGTITVSKGGSVTGTLGGKRIRERLVSARSSALGRRTAVLPTLAEAVARGRLIAASR